MDDDCRTRVQDVESRHDLEPDAEPEAKHSVEELFLANYEAMRNAASKDFAGVALVAVDTGWAKVEASAWMAQDTERPSALIVGSHEMCDLILSDRSLSLRHLAVLAPARASDAEVMSEFSLHDLRSTNGFTLEDGESALAATISRFGVVRLGHYVLFCFATAPDETWPESAADAWAALGGETKVACAKPLDAKEPAKPARPAKPRYLSDMRSRITPIEGPLRTSDSLLQDGEDQVAELRVRGGERVNRLALGSSALKRGVLVGRSDRCASILTDQAISRVHLLVIALGEDIIGVDTGSTNGVFCDPQAKVATCVIMLSCGEQAALVDEDASVSLR